MERDSYLHSVLAADRRSKPPFGAGLAAIEIASDIIISCESVDDLSGAVSILRDMLGFEHLIFNTISGRACAHDKPFLSLTYSDAWVKRYCEENYFSIDPVMLRGSKSPLPFDWSELPRECKHVRKLFDEAERHGVGRSGVTVPIRGHGGERSMLTATSNVPQADWERYRKLTIRTLAEVGQFLHEKSLSFTEKQSHQHAKLSRRERQCLQLLAFGKVPKEIAHDLELSVSAVRLYLYSARSKLGGATLYQAVSRAVSLRLIVA